MAMVYESKFNMGQEIWLVSDGEHFRTVICVTCQQTGKVTIGSQEFHCPACEGRCTRRQWSGKKYYIRDRGIIGKITVEHQCGGKWGDHEPKVSYMIDTLGIGSGTILSEGDLFATREEAQTYCDRHNSTLRDDEA